MKSLLVVLLAAGSLSLSAGIIGTKHDLSTNALAGQGHTNTTQVCVFCHTPHNAAATQLAPLWNRKFAGTTPTFTLYSSATLTSTPTQPTGASLACFTCHDGTTSVGNLINMPSDTATFTYTAGGNVSNLGVLSGAPALGTDLSNDHPVSMTYPTKTGLVVPTVSGTTSNVGGLPLFTNKVECASCHDVHSNAIATPFLRASMTNSALCTTCHIK
ncbi:cytochrome c3 family protein [Geothrix fuzhouensis]|uniref:cytochrome c3 family protein n=1 Tax=Geothrix fuzhouensis TaxID=2966451 RepID=UPI00214907C5|nr:cytochrome c3 family protein [Geothrix fuzhouensis]